MLFSDPVKQALNADDVVSLKADITAGGSPDDQFLNELNDQFGIGTAIPLLLVFAPGVDEPIVLRDLYSRADLIGAIEQARAEGLEATASAP